VEKPATIDEEFILLDSALAALKIEHEVFFRNPIKRPPADLKWKVLSLLRKFSDDSKMTFSQMYRYNPMAQRYDIYGDWRIREEGYRGRKMRCCPCRVRAKRNTKPRTRFMVSAIIRPGRQIRRLLLPVRCGCGTQKNRGPLQGCLFEAKKKAREAVSGTFDFVSPLRFEEKQTNPQGIGLP